jgi:SAM-dependent methyltransferase
MSAPDFDWRLSPMGQSNPHETRKTEKAIHDLLAILKPEDTLLDAGCYHGHLYGYLTGYLPEGKRPQYLGIDLRQENVDRAIYLHGDRFRVQDILSLEGSWDVIFCCRVLMHVPPWEEAVRRLLACARKHLVLVLPFGGYSCEVEMHGGEPVYFQKFSPSQFDQFGPSRIIKREPYSTVIFSK